MIGIFIHRGNAARRITIDAADAGAITGAFSVLLFSCFPESRRADWRRADAAEAIAPRSAIRPEPDVEGDDARDTRHYPSIEGDDGL